MIATGRSQSAFRLVTYINAVHPLAHPFDGYLVHSRGANASGFKAEGLARDAENAVPPGAHIRTDIDVPVLDLQTEGDMVALRAHLTRQPPFAHYRRWEIAGAAHAETPRWVAEVPPPLDMGPGLQGSGEQRAASRGREGGAERADAVGARRRRAAAVAGDRAGTGSRPRRIRSSATRTATRRAASACRRSRRRRRPSTAAPTPARRNAAGAGAARNFCFLFGRTKPFDAATLKALYPTHDAFVKQFDAAVDALVKDGYWLAAEAAAAKKAAQESAIGR